MCVGTHNIIWTMMTMWIYANYSPMWISRGRYRSEWERECVCGVEGARRMNRKKNGWLVGWYERPNERENTAFILCFQHILQMWNFVKKAIFLPLCLCIHFYSVRFGLSSFSFSRSMFPSVCFSFSCLSPFFSVKIHCHRACGWRCVFVWMSRFYFET